MMMHAGHGCAGQSCAGPSGQLVGQVGIYHAVIVNCQLLHFWFSQRLDLQPIYNTPLLQRTSNGRPPLVCTTFILTRAPN